MKLVWRSTAPALAALAAICSFAAIAQTAQSSGPAAEGGEEPPPPQFTEEYLGDPANIAAGREVWQQQCRHCHGRAAYPGKAPKLKPRRYKPDFVYNRVTNGFRKMPSWKAVFNREQRMAVVAYVLSREFSP